MLNNSVIIDEYFSWIREKLNLRPRVMNKWRGVFLLLNNIPYEWEHPMDENRYEDGLYFRKSFLRNSTFGDGLDRYGGPTVLEVLSEFAIRIDSEYVGVPGKTRPGDILIEFMRNLGIEPEDYREESYVIYLVDRWMRENHGAIFGFGGDFGGQQLWDLMLRWINERR